MPIPILGKIPPGPEAAKHGIAVARSIVDPNPPMVAETVSGPLREDRPSPESDGIREMRFDERHQVAQSVAEAFEHDPHFSYLLKNDAKRLQKLGNGVVSFLEEDWLPNGVVHTHDKLFGAAIWTLLGKWQTSGSDQFNILRSLTGKVSPADVGRLANALLFVENKHKEIEDKIGPHYYLPMLGVTPEWQRRGWGDALLRLMLERCDQEGAIAYLEASNERNLPLYLRNDFEVIAKGRYRGGLQPIHFMYRRPQ